MAAFHEARPELLSRCLEAADGGWDTMRSEDGDAHVTSLARCLVLKSIPAVDICPDPDRWTCRDERLDVLDAQLRGDDRANAVTVAPTGTGALSATYVSLNLLGTAQVIFDVTGYFVP